MTAVHRPAADLVASMVASIHRHLAGGASALNDGPQGAPVVRPGGLVEGSKAPSVTSRWRWM